MNDRSSIVHIQLQIIDVHDVSSIYRVPLILDDQQMDFLLAKRLELSLPSVRPPRFLLKWKDLADRLHFMAFNFIELHRLCYDKLFVCNHLESDVRFVQLGDL